MLQRWRAVGNTVSTGARRNFSGGRGDKRQIHYLLGEIKRRNCNQDFAKGEEGARTKRKNDLVRKNVASERRVEQIGTIQMYYEGGVERSPSRWAIFAVS